MNKIVKRAGIITATGLTTVWLAAYGDYELHHSQDTITCHNHIAKTIDAMTFNLVDGTHVVHELGRHGLRFPESCVILRQPIDLKIKDFPEPSQ